MILIIMCTCNYISFSKTTMCPLMINYSIIIIIILTTKCQINQWLLYEH